MYFKQLREIFIFTRKERNGLLVLIFILLLTVCLDFCIPLFVPGKIYDVSEWKAEAEKFYAKVPEVKAEIKSGDIIRVIDPNEANPEDLSRMGVPAGLASNWVKYLKKGGHFAKKEEVKKLYGMTEEIYLKVERYLTVPGKKIADDGNKKSSRPGKNESPGYVRRDSLPFKRETSTKPFQLVEVNQADSAQLESLPGIGPVLASRIIKYRRLTGGFYDLSQLKEIYGMTDELYAKFSPALYADSLQVKKLKINFLTPSELGRHPYIGFRQAKKIVKTRATVGKFRSKEELIALFSGDSLRRLLPYLSTGSIEP